MKRNVLAANLALITALAGVAYGCHADADDPAGQAGELGDPVRQQNAIENISRLYTTALTKAREQHEDADPRTVETVENAEGREIPGPKAIADATIAQLVATYRDRSPTPANGLRILDVLNEMQDPRAIPAYLKALEWRAEISEEHAIRAANAVKRIEVPEDQKGPLIEALASALERVEGSRGDDNRMRIAFIQALGYLGDQRATPALTRVMTRLTEDQNFLINRMAAEELGRLGDPAAVPDLIRALFLTDPNNPMMRMNDVAEQALVTIGRPSYDPLVTTLAGDNEQANAIAQNYIRAVAQRDSDAAEAMDPDTIRTSEVCHALGQLGFPEAVGPIMEHITPLTSLSTSAAEDAEGAVIDRAMACIVSLASVIPTSADVPRIRQAIIDVYNRVPKQARPQLLVVMQHTYDGGLLDFLHTTAREPEEELPDIRVLAVRSYAFLANREEAARIRQVIEAEPGPEEGGYRTNFEEMNPALETAQECHEDVACYIGKLGDENTMVARKAAYMLGRYGAGNAEAISALIEQIDHRDVEVRGDVLYAIDRIATEGSAEAIAAIDELRRIEEGRASWNQVKSVAMAVRARLAARQGG